MELLMAGVETPLEKQMNRLLAWDEFDTHKHDGHNHMGVKIISFYEETVACRKQ